MKSVPSYANLFSLASIPGSKRRHLPYLLHAAVVDQLALKVAQRFLLGRHKSARLAEYLQRVGDTYSTPELLREPRKFFRPVKLAPDSVRATRRGRLRAGKRLDLTFASLYQPYNPAYVEEWARFSSNNQVYARVYQHDEQPRPTVICLHGWLGGHLWIEEQIFAANALYNAGIDVAIITLPFHGRRKPARKLTSTLFLGEDFCSTNEAFGQSVADIEALMQWLKHVSPDSPVGVLGISLGGYIAALMAELNPQLAFMISLIAPSSLADLSWQHALGVAPQDPADIKLLEQFRRTYAVHSPLSHPLAIAKDRTLIIGGRADRLVPPEQTLALWEHWQKPALEWFPGGHYMHFGRGDYLRRLCEFMGAPLPKPRGLRRWWP